ncbi:hypothetical protein GQ53DRAFT_4082 [Thozetella sp. PMI_491]|nr:hypothetical protein GQ53DRAFT_4082 [Thozetella sp. PMI_491]
MPETWSRTPGKRSRGPHSDGHGSPTGGTFNHQLAAGDPAAETRSGQQLTPKLVMDELMSALEEEYPESRKGWLACPFPRMNPERYAQVKDHACMWWGFKDIATLKDHIKRCHLSKYGCYRCKTRFTTARDKKLEDTINKHKDKCRSPSDVLPVSPLHPEVMEPGQDKVFLEIDFRAKIDGVNDVVDQYWSVCKAIWPEITSGSFNM